MDLDELFSYHPVEADQVAKYMAIRAAAKQFAQTILDNTPRSADQSASIRKLREAVMTANASIALKGKF
jgi:hypothetical protein